MLLPLLLTHARLPLGLEPLLLLRQQPPRTGHPRPQIWILPKHSSSGESATGARRMVLLPRSELRVPAGPAMGPRHPRLATRTRAEKPETSPPRSVRRCYVLPRSLCKRPGAQSLPKPNSTAQIRCRTAPSSICGASSARPSQTAEPATAAGRPSRLPEDASS